jgi:hypothetical protein
LSIRHVFLIQILLPLYDRAGTRLPRDVFERVAAELTEGFGGMTAYANSPARGLWDDGTGQAQHDDIIVHEVMTETVDQAWWAKYRSVLEARFSQDQVVIRALEMQRL